MVRRKTIAIVCSIGLPFILCVSCLAQVRHANRLAARLIKLEKAGLPYDAESTQKWYSARTNDKDSIRWKKLVSKFAQIEDEASNCGIPLLSPKQQDAEYGPNRGWRFYASTRKFLQRYQTELTEFQTLSKSRTPVRFPIAFEGYNTILGWTAGTRNLSMLAYLDGLVGDYEGDSGRVHRNIIALIGAMHVCSEEPFLISRFVCMEINQRAIELSQVAVKNNRLLENDIQEIAAAFQERAFIGSRWASCVHGSRGVHLPSFAGKSAVFPNGESVPHPPDMNRALDALFYIETMERAAQFRTDDLDAFVNAGRRLESELEQLILHSDQCFGLGIILSGVLIPSFKIATEQFAENAALNRLAAIALNIELYRIEHQTLPDSFAELHRSVRYLRPAGGKHFGYEKDGSDARLWGFSLKDAGATPSRPPTSSSPWVWTWNKGED